MSIKKWKGAIVKNKTKQNKTEELQGRTSVELPEELTM